MTTEVGLFEAKTHLSELVEKVASGAEDFIITRRGKPVARIVPIETESPVEQALAMLAEVRAMSRPGSGTLRELIDEGRRL